MRSTMGRISLAANRTEPETYTIDDTIRVPVTLRDEDGVADGKPRTKGS
jgi:hypothetical protein